MPPASATPTINTSYRWQLLSDNEEGSDDDAHSIDDEQAPPLPAATSKVGRTDRGSQQRDRQWPAANSSFATKAGASIRQIVVPAAIPSSPQLTDAVRAAASRIQARVGLYDGRMSPKEGKLPKCRGAFNHKMQLNDDNVTPVKGHAIPLNAEERVQLALDIRELETAGLIVRSESEWASPAFYVAKDGGKSRRLVIDYRGLNRLLKRNAMTLPHIDELLARLGKAKFFSKIDLRSSYHQVLI